MAGNKPSSQTVGSESSFSSVRSSDSRATYSTTDYRIKALEEIHDIENKLRRDEFETAKSYIDAEYDYRKSKLDKEKAYQEKIDKAYASNKVKIQEKYKLSDDPKTWQKKYQDKLNKQLEADKKYLQAKMKAEEEAEANLLKKLQAQDKRAGAGIVRNMTSSGSLADWTKWRDFHNQTDGLSGGAKFGAVVDGLLSGLSDFAKKLDSTIDTIGSYQSKWDTRLYGYSGSSYTSITKAVTGAAGISPYVQQSKVMQNIDNLIQQGIAYNVEQRGFLQTIADKIATTFDAANGTLLQLVRVQQQDTTAARLGLEAGVTKYLNNMFSSSEYMTSLYKTVLGNIYEASSQFSGSGSIGFEYQVQKWLGSLYSVGMSQSAISNISSAIGALGSGNINSLAGSPMQNLLVMAASRGGLSYADLLTGGLSGNNVNQLMQGMVTYLAEVANSGNNVVKSQYANIFGMSLSDLKAISNLSSSVSTIANSSMGYSSAMGNLFNMANSIGNRTSTGEFMGNLWNNIQYSMASGIATNPALYGLYKASGLLDSVAGGIALPDIKYIGTGVNLQTTVADLMRVTSLSGGIISSIAQMISAGGNGGLTGSGLLKGMGISQGNLTTISRGNGVDYGGSGESISRSTYIGNANSNDLQTGVVAENEASANDKMVQLKEESAGDDIKLADVNENVIKIYELLRDDTISVYVTEEANGDQPPFPKP